MLELNVLVFYVCNNAFSKKIWSIHFYVQKKSGNSVCYGHKWELQSKCKQMRANTNSRRAVQEAGSRSRRKKSASYYRLQQKDLCSDT